MLERKGRFRVFFLHRVDTPHVTFISEIDVDFKNMFYSMFERAREKMEKIAINDYNYEVLSAIYAIEVGDKNVCEDTYCTILYGFDRFALPIITIYLTKLGVKYKIIVKPDYVIFEKYRRAGNGRWEREWKYRDENNKFAYAVARAAIELRDRIVERCKLGDFKCEKFKMPPEERAASDAQLLKKAERVLQKELGMTDLATM